MVKREQLGFMTAPPLRMLCCHVRRQQLIEMEEHGLVHAPLSSFYLSVLLGRGGSRVDSSLQVRSSFSLPPSTFSLSSEVQISSGSGLVGTFVRSLREGTSQPAG